jgi:hypothetical protein
VSLIPCDRCAERGPGKLTNCTWAWYRSDGERAAWRQRLCLTCVATLLAPLYQKTAEWSLTCPACGVDTAEDLDPVYCTFYPDGAGKMILEAPTCPSCAARIRVEAQKGARKLEAVDASFGGQVPSPQTSATATWESLGIVPRDRS